MFERFTEKARQVVVSAKSSAHELGHNYIGTEHLLLGLLAAEDGLAAKVLGELGVTTEVVRLQVEEIIGRGEGATKGELRFTPRAKKALELSLREAISLGHDYIGTEHILLGIERTSDGVAARILLELGAGPDAVRQRLVEVLGVEPSRSRRPRRIAFGRRSFLETQPAEQWEYHVEHCDAIETSLLNELGERGWELVGIVPPGDGLDLVFKRRRVGLEARRASA